MSGAKKSGVVGGESLLSARSKVSDLETVEAYTPHLQVALQAASGFVCKYLRFFDTPKQRLHVAYRVSSSDTRVVRHHGYVVRYKHAVKVNGAKSL